MEQKNCNNCEQCGDTPLTTLNPVQCPTPIKCSEIIDGECVLYTGDDINCGETTIVSTDDSISTAIVSIVDYLCGTGLQGIQGTQGVQGVQGLQGKTGMNGLQGPAGTSVNIIGSVPNVNEVPPGDPQIVLNTAFPSATNGEGVLDDLTGDLWVFNGTTWNNVGNIQGPPGPSGSQGTQGPQGTQGANGTNGSNGIQGSQGVQGLKGNDGSAGIPGAQGATGESIQGIQGVQGVQGLRGVQGNTGQTGPTGDAGIQGPQGTQGSTGSSGSTGSQGAQGVQGLQGSSGINGSQGAQGTQGSTGNIGLTGIQGTQGTQGVQGRQGPQGATGAGIQGPQGATGAPGFGTTGAQGAQGVQGTDGAFAAQGVQGAEGPQGPAGSGGGGTGGGRCSTDATLIASTSGYFISQGDGVTFIGSNELCGWNNCLWNEDRLCSRELPANALTCTVPLSIDLAIFDEIRICGTAVFDQFDSDTDSGTLMVGLGSVFCDPSIHDIPTTCLINPESHGGRFEDSDYGVICFDATYVVATEALFKCRNHLIVYLGVQNGSGTYPANIKFSYSLTAVKTCVDTYYDAEPCCGGPNELVYGTYVIGATYVSTTGYCYNIIGYGSAGTPTISLISSSVYVDCPTCTTANPCP